MSEETSLNELRKRIPEKCRFKALPIKESGVRLLSARRAEPLSLATLAYCVLSRGCGDAEREYWLMRGPAKELLLLHQFRFVQLATHLFLEATYSGHEVSITFQYATVRGIPGREAIRREVTRLLMALRRSDVKRWESLGFRFRIDIIIDIVLAFEHKFVHKDRKFRVDFDLNVCKTQDLVNKHSLDSEKLEVIVDRITLTALNWAHYKYVRSAQEAEDARASSIERSVQKLKRKHECA